MCTYAKSFMHNGEYQILLIPGASVFSMLLTPFRNGEAWYKVRSAVHKLMMHPGAAAIYLPVQNKVADDLVKLIEEELDSQGFVPDFQNLITKYALECKCLNWALRGWYNL